MQHANRMTVTAVAVVMGLSTLAGPGYGSDDADHYVPEAAETLEQAVAYFVRYSDEVAQIVASDSLSVEEMERVHELTYTLEVALAKMNEELTDLPEVLETLHKASEGDDVAAFKKAAAAYLETAQAMSP